MKRKCAVVTLSHNEAVFLPIWMKYYSTLFEGEDIYVLDHDSTDGSVERLKEKYKFNHIKVSDPTYQNNTFMTGAYKKYQKKLFKKYELVLCSDTDELVITDPLKYLDLKDYIEKFTLPFVACESRSLIQSPDEYAIDLSKPLLKQRSVWFEELHYNKVLLSRVPLDWVHGMHYLNAIKGIPEEKQPEYPIDEALILLHLHRFDYGICERKRLDRREEKWGGVGTESYQHQLFGEDLKQWFWNHSIERLEKIPERFKEIV